MRWMRENSVQIFFSVFLISVIYGGTVFYKKNRNTVMQTASSHVASSHTKEHAQEHSKEHASAIETVHRKVSSEKPKRESDEMPVEHPTIVEKSHHAEKSEDEDSGEPICKSIEFLGEGFQKTLVSTDEWKSILDVFHQSKKALIVWLDKHHTKFSEQTIQLMKSQLENVKLIRPPFIEEPDLNWRGIGVFSRDEKGNPQIRLSSGFLKLIQRDQKRAEFEITRLVAQSWAPCEFHRLGVLSPWNSLLQCFEIQDDPSCAPGVLSEGGWAVSSTLATMVSSLDCKLPALTRSQKGECVPK